MEDQPDNHVGPSVIRRFTRGTRKRMLEETEDRARPQTGNSQEPVEQMDSDSGDEPVNQPNRQEGQEQRPQEQGRNVTKELKLKMPEFKGKKGRDPQVHVQAFESWQCSESCPGQTGKSVFLKLCGERHKSGISTTLHKKYQLTSRCQVL